MPTKTGKPTRDELLWKIAELQERVRVLEKASETITLDDGVAWLLNTSDLLCRAAEMIVGNPTPQPPSGGSEKR